MRKVLLFILLNLMCFSVWAQMKEVTGRVTSKADGEPLAGVNVIIKGSSRGTQTDGDGRFTLKVETGAILTFSSLGFKDYEVKYLALPLTLACKPMKTTAGSCCSWFWYANKTECNRFYCKS